jgi:site-specific recombinase XerD
LICRGIAAHINVPQVGGEFCNSWKPFPAKKASKRTADKNNLLFPTTGCKPNTHFLEYLKDVAKRAKLDPNNFWLHKFRATFATWHLWKGVDLRTVQDWMGHTDIESTMRYLKPNRNKAVREKVNETFAGRA